MRFNRSLAETRAAFPRLAAVITAGLTSTLYWWRLGVASTSAAVAALLAVGFAGVAFVIAAWKLARPI